MLNVIRQWVIKTMMKSKGQTGVVQTLPKRDLIELNTQITAQRLMQNGVDPQALKNTDQVENAIIAIENRPKVQQGIGSTKSAKVFDMEGQEIPKGSKIMGGKATETEAEIAARMSKENKETTQRIKNRKMVKDAIDNASPGFVKGDRKYNAQLVAEDLADKKFGKEFYDLDQRQQMDLYDEALEGLSEQTRGMPDPEDFAQGGRAGFDNGGAPSIKYDFDKEKKPMGPTFETNDPKEALKEIVRRMINVEPAKIPLSKDMMLMFDLDRAKIGGSKDIGGGQLNFGINKGFGRDDTGIGFEFRKQFASGGITALKSLLNYFAKQRGTKGSQQLKEINPKSVPSGIMNIMGPEHRKMLERNQTDYLESLLDTIKSDKKFLDKNKEIAKQVQKDIDKAGFGDFTTAEEMLQPFIKNAMKGDTLDRMKVYDKINVDDAIIDIEQMIKNRRMRESDGRALNATGGRIGFKDGMTRRTFLKLLGGMAAIPIVGKFLKPLKTAKGVKKVPMIATDNVPGKPEWFDQLVNKVILEGDDVTKKFATGERQSIHQKTLDDGSVVRVTEDVDDGAVRVEYESEQNVFGDPVQMEYRKPLPDEGAPNPAAEFGTAESGPVSRRSGPDDFDIEVDEVGGTSIRDLDSDVSKLKEYATGKGPTMQELVQNIKRKDKAKAITEGGDEMIDAVTRRQGDYDPFASGGIARMLGE